MSEFSYPENPAPTDAAILDVIKRRWSPVAFSNEPIEADKMNSLFEALRWTQSSRNEQPWRIIYATHDDQEDFDRLGSVLFDGNAYAKEAYLLIMACALPNHEYKNKPNWNHQYDTGAAMHALVLQATQLNLVTHQMEGFDKDKAHMVLGVPEEVVPMAMMVIGYPGDEAKLSEDLQPRQQVGKRERREISDIFFKGKWK